MFTNPHLNIGDPEGRGPSTVGRHQDHSLGGQLGGALVLFSKSAVVQNKNGLNFELG